MISEHEGPGALVILANFVSPPAVDLAEESVLRQWAEQAPRKLWLTRPGDVLITPVPFTAPFRRYVFHLPGEPENSVDVTTVPDTPYLPMAQALAEHNLLEPLRALVAERPTASDRAGRSLRRPGHRPAHPRRPLRNGHPEPRHVAGGRPHEHEVGVPHGRTVSRAAFATRPGLHRRGTRPGDHRAAGLAPTGGPQDGPVRRRPRPALRQPWRPAVTLAPRPLTVTGWWRSTWNTPAPSAPGGTPTATRVEVAFDGEMPMSGGSFAGYCSPLQDLPARAREELTDWTQTLGGHLAAEGYRGRHAVRTGVKGAGPTRTGPGKMPRPGAQHFGGIVSNECKAPGMRGCTGEE